MELRDEEARARADAAPRPALGAYWPHLAESQARRARRRGQRVLPARRLDFEQIQESIEGDWAKGALVRGASTITQQLAKNLYLSPSRNPLRKLRELIIARRLEAELTKARIFEIYLNAIEWGDGVCGAEAAARTYFGTVGVDARPAEAALLAGAIINPRVLNPAHPTRGCSPSAAHPARMGGVTPPPAETPAPAERRARAGPPSNRSRRLNRAPAPRRAAARLRDTDAAQVTCLDQLVDAAGADEARATSRSSSAARRAPRRSSSARARTRRRRWRCRRATRPARRW